MILLSFFSVLFFLSFKLWCTMHVIVHVHPVHVHVHVCAHDCTCTCTCMCTVLCPAGGSEEGRSEGGGASLGFDVMETEEGGDSAATGQ